MIKWTPKSESDLEEIWDHIAENFNPKLASQKVNQIIDHVEHLLSRNPLAGAVLEQNPLFSVIFFEGNAIYYAENPRDKNIYIVYVRAGELSLKAIE